MVAVMATDTTAVVTAGAVTITDGTEAAVTTNGVTIAAGKAFVVFAFRHSHCPDDRRIAATRSVAPSRRGRFSGSGANDSAGAQPSPISTAIRIRSEWFLAPSFCLSSEVVLATVL